MSAGGKMTRQNQASAYILNHGFSSMEELTRYLDSVGLEYLLKEDPIGNEPPTNAAIQLNTKQPVRYLVLLPSNSRKLFRFRIYDRIEGGLYIESDFSYKNPYQW